MKHNNYFSATINFVVSEEMKMKKIYFSKNGKIMVLMFHFQIIAIF